MIIDGKRLSEGERLKFFSDLEHTGEFCELLPLGQTIAVLSSIPSGTENAKAETPPRLETEDRGTDLLQPATILAG